MPQAAQRISAIWKRMTAEEQNELVEDKEQKDRGRYKVENTVYVGLRLISNEG